MKILTLALILASLPLSQYEPAVADDALHIATVSVDITPPLGQPVGQGFIPILETAEHPLLARGILLKDSGVTCVICTLDLMEVHNASHDFLRQTIARAAGVRPSHVALHCIHQHTAPAISTGAQCLELKEDDPRRIATSDYVVDVAKKLSTAIRRSQKNWQRVTHIGTARAKVERVASNRRIERLDGSIQGRSSSTKSAPQLRDLPEGLIDPWVRTVSLDNGDRTVVHLHYYASHPQSFYGDHRASYDVPGIIRERLEKQTGAFQLYLNGCGGDVAFGKYNDGSRTARSELTVRLQSGIEQSIASLKRQPVEAMTWSVEPIKFPLRTDEAFSEAANRRILDDPQADSRQRRKAAIALAWIQRVKSKQEKPVELSCLSIGRVKMLHLPGEPFVQYQLAAQKMRLDRFVCVAGYGDCGMGYIGGDRIYTDRGGYEQTYAFAGPSEDLFLSTMKRLLTSDSDKETRPLTRDPILLAHRGLVRHAPENTLPAFAAAIELGLSIELDVYQTRDEQLVVIHDHTVDRTTNGSGEVNKMTLAEIRKLDAGSWFIPSFSGEKVPTLEEVFKLIHERQREPMTIALNMKVISPGIEQRIVALVDKYELFDQLFAFGQGSDSSRCFKEANAKLRTTVVKIYDAEQFAAALRDPLADCLWVGFVPSAEAMKQAHKLGKQVWLSLHIGENRPDIWGKARASKMDGICTDWPLECLQHWRRTARPTSDER